MDGGGIKQVEGGEINQVVLVDVLIVVVVLSRFLFGLYMENLFPFSVFGFC